MASLWKHPESRYWVACYTDATGKQRKRSTRSVDRTQAMRMAEEFEKSYRNLATEAQARRVLTDIYEQVHGRPLATATVEAFLLGWLKTKKAEATASTYARYENVTKAFLEFLGDRKAKDLHFLTVNDVTAFRDHIAARLSPSSTNLYLKILRTALKAAWVRDLIKENPAAKVANVKRAKGNLGARRPFTPDELHRLFNVADDEWRGLILFGLYTGQRLGDLASLTWRNLDLLNQELIIQTEKTGRNMVVPLAKPLLAYLNGIHPLPEDPNAPLFPVAFASTQDGGLIGTLSNRFHSLMVDAGIATERDYDQSGKGRAGARKAQPLSFHSLRHTATSMLKSAGVSEAVVMDIIGHDSAAVSRHYTHIDIDAKRRALDRMPEILTGGNA
jgi:integrase